MFFQAELLHDSEKQSCVWTNRLNELNLNEKNMLNYNDQILNLSSAIDLMKYLSGRRMDWRKCKNDKHAYWIWSFYFYYVLWYTHNTNTMQSDLLD